MHTNLIDGDKYIHFKGYWIGENGLVLNSNHTIIKSFPSIKINGKNYRKANLIADLWIGKPSAKANLYFKDGDNKNCKVSNMQYLTFQKPPATYKSYRKKVDELTRLQPIHILIDFDKRGFNKYHLDHIVSCMYGFKNKIEPKSIAHISNLQMITKKENMDKSHDSYCVISQCDHLKEKIWLK